MHTKKFILFVFTNIITLSLFCSEPTSCNKKKLQNIISTNVKGVIPFLQEHNDLVDCNLERGPVGHQLLFMGRISIFNDWLDLKPNCQATTEKDSTNNFPEKQNILQTFLFAIIKNHIHSQTAIPIVNKIIACNQNLINQKRNDGLTSAHIAAECGLYSVLKVLTENGADLQALSITHKHSTQKTTPLRILAERNHANVIRNLKHNAL